MTEMIQRLEGLFREMPGIPDVLKATIFCEPDCYGSAFKVWLGQGFYLIDYEHGARIIDSRDPAGGLKHTPAVHPARAAWPVLRGLVERSAVNERCFGRDGVVPRALARYWPDTVGAGAVQLDDDKMTVAAMAVLDELRKILSLKSGPVEEV